MKKFIVEIHYESSIYVEIEAEDEDRATAKAIAKAYTDSPYDGLYAEVVHIEEVKS
jgi:hypothetical protein